MKKWIFVLGFSVPYAGAYYHNQYSQIECAMQQMLLQETMMGGRRRGSRDPYAQMEILENKIKQKQRQLKTGVKRIKERIAGLKNKTKIPPNLIEQIAQYIVEGYNQNEADNTFCGPYHCCFSIRDTNKQCSEREPTSISSRAVVAVEPPAPPSAPASPPPAQPAPSGSSGPPAEPPAASQTNPGTEKTAGVSPPDQTPEQEAIGEILTAHRDISINVTDLKNNAKQYIARYNTLRKEIEELELAESQRKTRALEKVDKIITELKKCGGGCDANKAEGIKESIGGREGLRGQLNEMLRNMRTAHNTSKNKYKMPGKAFTQDLLKYSDTLDRTLAALYFPFIPFAYASLTEHTCAHITEVAPAALYEDFPNGANEADKDQISQCRSWGTWRKCAGEGGRDWLSSSSDGAELNIDTICRNFQACGEKAVMPVRHGEREKESCEKFLESLQKQAKKRQKILDEIERLQEQIEDIELREGDRSLGLGSDTEAGGTCYDCGSMRSRALEMRDAMDIINPRPTIGQSIVRGISNVLPLAAGITGAYFMQRQHDKHSARFGVRPHAFAGNVALNLTYPYIMKSLYGGGLAGPGGMACSPTMAGSQYSVFNSPGWMGHQMHNNVFANPIYNPMAMLGRGLFGGHSMMPGMFPGMMGGGDPFMTGMMPGMMPGMMGGDPYMGMGMTGGHPGAMYGMGSMHSYREWVMARHQAAQRRRLNTMQANMPLYQEISRIMQQIQANQYGSYSGNSQYGFDPYGGGGQQAGPISGGGGRTSASEPSRRLMNPVRR